MEENNDTYVTSLGGWSISQPETLEAAEECETKERGRRTFFLFPFLHYECDLIFSTFLRVISRKVLTDLTHF